MKINDIIDAYCRIRTIDQTIPDNVLDFMYRLSRCNRFRKSIRARCYLWHCYKLQYQYS